MQTCTLLNVRSNWLISFFRFRYVEFVPEIFAIEVESCQKSRRNLDVFFGSPKVVRALSPLPRDTSGKVSWGYSHQSRSYWGSHAEFEAKFLIFTIKIFGGPPSQLGYALGSLGQSLARVKNLRAQHSLRAEILCPEKCPLGWVNMHLYNFFICGPKFNRFLLSNLGGVVVDQLLFRFLTCPHVPEIFAIKVESCPKSSLRNLDVFLTLPNFRGGPSQNCTHVITPA